MFMPLANAFIQSDSQKRLTTQRKLEMLRQEVFSEGLGSHKFLEGGEDIPCCASTWKLIPPM